MESNTEKGFSATVAADASEEHSSNDYETHRPLPLQGEQQNLHGDNIDFGRAKQNFQKRQKSSWHTSAVDWKEKSTWDNGRVLLIDYIRQNRSTAGKTRIAAHEISDVQGLHKFYSKPSRCGEAALRVIHVQNAPWAAYYLLRKFNINAPDNLLGMDFGSFVKDAKPEWRGGKPLLKGKTWRTQRDPWRGVRRTAFGMDYLRPCGVQDHLDTSQPRPNVEAKMMELNGYDDTSTPAYSYDVFVQRLSVYVQYNDGVPPPEDLKNPYPEQNGDHSKEKNRGGDHGQKRRSLPPVEWLDNGNTIIIFENSRTRSVKDTLIGARNEIETRWRRLSFYLPQRDLQNDSRLALECMDLILKDIFKGLAVSWEHFLAVAETHVSILEDKIYESPADETRAPELWYNSSAWLKIERLVYIHQDVVREILSFLTDMTEDSEVKTDWLDGTVDEFQKVTNLLEEDLTKPTDALSDLMYKSVEIRDSRHSLQLNTSMWRLSWITFIFLPLTFMVGFFGMNVDTFEGNPSIKWWIISAVVMLLLVLIAWYLLKHALAAHRQTPYQRGIYEHLFYDLAVAHPKLWSRSGPREEVKPVGVWSTLRWRLLRFWFHPSKTVSRQAMDPDDESGGSGLGSWARFKRLLAHQWLGSIETRRPSISDSEAGESQALVDLPAVSEVVAMTTPTLVAEGAPAAQNVTRANAASLSPPLRPRSNSPQGSGSGRRPSSSRPASGMMVEERDINAPEDLEQVDWTGVGRSVDNVLEGSPRVSFV